MSDSTQVSLTLDVNAGPLQRELAKASREYEKLQKVASKKSPGGGGGVFDRKALGGFVKGVGKLNKELDGVQSRYRSIAKEAAKFEKAKATKGGPATGRGAFAEGFAASAPGPFRGMMDLWKMRKEDHGKSRMAGHAVGGAGSLVTRALMWGFNKVQQGEAVLGRYQAAKAGTQAMIGRHPNSENFQKTAVKQGHALAFTRDQTHQIIQQTLRTTGRLSAAGVQSTMRMNRAYGVDIGTQGQMHQTGRMAGDRDDISSINRGLVNAIKMGDFPRALATELAQASTGLVQILAQVQERVSMRQTTGLIALLSKRLGGVFGGNPVRTAQLAGGLHNFIRKPGDEGMNALMLTSLGMGKDTDYMGARARQRKGFTGKNLKRVVPYMKKFFGNNEKLFIEAMTSASGGQISDFGAKRLFRANLKGMDQKAIDKMTNQKAPETKADAERIARGLTVQGRQIKRDEAGAAAATNASKLLDQQVAVVTTAVDKLGKSLKVLGEAVDWLAGKIFFWRKKKDGPPNTRTAPGSLTP